MRRIFKHPFANGLWALALSTSLYGCQTDGVSLEQARQIAAGIQGPRFEAPPNSVTDILSLIAADRPEDLAQLEQATKTASGRAPSNVSDDALARFYASRGDASQRLGRVNAAISDYVKAADLAKNSSSRIHPNDSSAWTLRAGSLMVDNGDLIKGLGLIESSTEILRRATAGETENALGQTHGRIVAFESVNAIVNARIGDLAKAKAALKRAHDSLREFDSVYAFGRQYGALTRDDTLGYEISYGTLSAAESRVAALSGDVDLAITFAQAGIQRLSKFDKGISGLSQDFLVTLRINAYDDLAELLLKKDRQVEAEVAARQALVISTRDLGRYHIVTTGALAALSAVLLDEGRYEQAEAIGRRAIADLGTIQASDNARAGLQARLTVARALAAHEQWTNALTEFKIVEAGYKGFAPGAAEFWLAADSGFSVAAYFAGDTALASRLADVELRWSKELLGADSYRAAEAEAFLGAIKWKIGQKDEAKRLLEKSIPAIVTAQSSIKHPFLARQRTEAILGALLDSAGSGAGGTGGSGSAIETAFRLAEQTRSGKLAESLNAAAARASAKSLPGLSELIRQKDDVEFKAEAANRMFAEALISLGAPRDDPRIVGLRNAAAKLVAAGTALQGEIDRQFPSYRSIVAPPAADFVTLTGTLEPSETLVSIFDGAERTFVWAIPKNGPSQLAVVTLSGRELAKTIVSLRGALAPSGIQTLGDIPKFDIELAYQTYAKLLRPVEAAFRNSKQLVVVATGAVPSLPLSVLPTERATSVGDGDILFSEYRRVPWLARKYAVSYIPSAATLVALRRISAPLGTKPFVGFGDPIFSANLAVADADTSLARGAPMRGAPIRLRASPPISDRQVTIADLPRLADTAREITEIAKALDADVQTDVFLQQRATEESVKQLSASGALANFRIVSFATHGLVPGELSGLRQPALALSNPILSKSAATGADGLLTLDEILGLKIDADWTVLSACNTGGSDGTSSEALSGLGQAFFFAGSRALLVSNWPVHSEATAALMISAFTSQSNTPESTRANAFRSGMIDLIDREVYRLDDGREAFSYAHPLFWAPFTVVGDGGTLRRASGT